MKYAPLIVTLLLIPSCKKEGLNEQIGPYHFEAKEYFNQKIGTTWIYEDSVTGIRDTVVLEKLGISMDRVAGKNRSIEYEKVEADYFSSSLKTRYKYHTKEPFPDNRRYETEDFFVYHMKVDAYLNDLYIASGQTFFYPFDTIWNSGDGVLKIGYLYSMDEYQLLGKNYHGVVVFEVKNDPLSTVNFEKKDVKYLWAKEAGLIQKIVSEANGSLIANWQLASIITP